MSVGHICWDLSRVPHIYKAQFLGGILKEATDLGGILREATDLGVYT